MVAISFLAAPPVFALSPLVQFNDLVAGEGDQGYADGDFYSAKFNYPEGLALSPQGDVLYVADWANNRIRSVSLDNKNAVNSLVGTGAAGWVDGDLSKATLYHPFSLTCLSDGRLVVGEERSTGGYDIRLIDLARKTVSTLAGEKGALDGGDGSEVPSLWNLVYRPADDCVYFSMPELGAVKRIRMKTGKVETVFQNNPSIPNPKALCLLGDRLFVADKQLEPIYQVMDLDKTVTPQPTATPGLPISLQQVGKAAGTIAMAGYGESLYAYQGKAVTQTPLVRVFPDPVTLNFGSVWGYVVNDATNVYPAFINVNTETHLGFLADSRSDGRFFLSNPDRSIVSSFRDLRFGNLMSDGIASEYTYPPRKPHNTYRILFCGRSHLYYEINKNWNGNQPLNVSTDIMDLFSKQLEVELNTLAALEDCPTHFEVLNYGRVASSMLYVWPYYELPAAVDKYDVDQVVIFFDSGSTDLVQLLVAPLTKEGILRENFDSNQDIRESLDKIPSNALGDFFKLCKEKNLLTVQENKHWDVAPMDKLLADDQVKDKLGALMGGPMVKLKAKLEGHKTSWGKATTLSFFYFPDAALNNFPQRIERDFWKDLCQADGVGFLDLTDDVLATRLTYYPLSELEGHDHFSKNGHDWMSRLLAYELIKKKWIPFDTPKD